jgi:putative mRNA 3-end processing factor
MRLSFLGAGREVGRSAVLLDTEKEKMLLDYGLKINEKPTEYPEDIKTRINAVLLSHAHLDHCGAIPVVFHHGQDCPVYSTAVTKPLSKMLMIDSHKISRYEGEEERFSKRDIGNAIKHFKTVKYRKSFRVGKSWVTFFDAGHIPGSALILIEKHEKRILYTGDFNLSDTRLIKGADTKIPEVNYLITESTYADREHTDRHNEERKMIEAIKETMTKGGVALISCFAISRAQEIILILDEYDLRENIFIDGMSKKATNIINSYPDLQTEYDQVKKAMKRLGVTFITSSSIRKMAIEKPSIIITTSGMLTGGPITHYIEKLHDKENCSLLLTGFQVPGTEGANLLKTGRYIHGDLDLDMKMSVRKFEFSSHAPRTDLFRFVRKVNPEKVFCIHGDNSERFAQELREEYGFDAVAPKNGKNYFLNGSE